ncbi:MAG: response regulator transcription factor [Betaproteobacteria bacterium]|nr:response regulator transcription factor [Betaproteobacteria bacterium]
MTKPCPPTVYIVDDDAAVRDALGALLGTVHLCSLVFASAEAFLAVANREMRGCLLLDVRMPGMSGLELQRKLQDLGITLPVAIITGHGDVPMAVRALKAGASDFIEKPFNEQDLLDRIQTYLKTDQDAWHARQAHIEAAARFARLTPREMAVMELIAAGGHTKRIAAQLDIQARTVDVHRFNIMHKAGVRTLAELLQYWSISQQPPLS